MMLELERDVPMARGGDKVEHDMDTIISETRVTLDTRFHRKNVIVLLLHEVDNLREAAQRGNVSIKVNL